MNERVQSPLREGYIDRIENGWLVGWAWTPSVPDEPVGLDVFVDGVRVSTFTAARYRADLERQGKGDGRHAFEVRLLDAISDGRTHEVRVVYGSTECDLAGSPARVFLGPGAAAAAPGRDACGYRSRFGGLWTDLPNARGIVEGKRALGWISAAEAALLEVWIDRGFVILPGAVPHQLIDELDETVERIWGGTSSDRYFVEFWEGDHRTVEPAGPRFKDRRVKLLDLYAHSEVARRMIFASPLTRFLSLVFERPPLAFQSLYFRWGSEQDIHQDTAFVKVSSPLELAASWIALEDVQPGSGELEYYVGSHQLADYLFEGAFKWMPFRSAEYGTFIASLRERSQARGFEPQRFLPRKGDVLIWSADLAHGGSKDVIPGLTRKSLVTHYCPTTCEPVYSEPGVTYPRQRFADCSFTCAPR